MTTLTIPRELALIALDLLWGVVGRAPRFRWEVR